MEVIRKKLKALKDKLEEAEKEATQAEDELNTINMKVKAKEEEIEQKSTVLCHLEEELDSAEDKSCDFTRQLSHSELSAEECRQARKILENRSFDDGKRVIELEAELEILLKDNEVCCAKLNKMQSDVEETEERVEAEEERVEERVVRVKELEMEATQKGNLLRSMVVIEQHGHDRVTAVSIKIQAKTVELELKKREAEELEDLVDQKCQDLDGKERELIDIKKKNEQTKEELDSILAEISDL